VNRAQSQQQDTRFQALLAWLDSDNERAGQEYVRLHRRLTKMFEARGCLTPEECADDTFNRVARQLAEGKQIRTDSPAAYLIGVARFVLREQWGKQSPQPINDGTIDSIARSDSRDDEQERRQQCLDQCLDKLPLESRLLVLEYYAEDKSMKIDVRESMARRLGVTAGVLRNRMFKLRNSLRACVATCLA